MARFHQLFVSRHFDAAPLPGTFGPKSRDAVVISIDLDDAITIFHYGHRAKLENQEPFRIETTALLPE